MSQLPDMDFADQSELEAIARAHYEVEMEGTGITGGRWFKTGCAVIPIAGIVSAFAEPQAVILFLLWLVSWPLWGLVKKWLVSSDVAQFRAGRPAAVLEVYRVAVKLFEARIGHHRARTLGSESEWGRARAALAERTDSASGQVVYWRARVREDPGNEMATTQLKAANAVHDKLQSAMAKLDARVSVLLRFYNECEAKLALMDRYNSDLEKARNLEKLTGEADLVVAEAEGTLAAIGAQFLQEAHWVGEALGGLERIQIKELAGEANLDNIEHMADRIIESSEADRRSIEELRQVLNWTPADPRQPADVT